MAKSESSKKAKYSKEVEEIKRMRDLNKILKAGDVENALLSNSAKDSETMNDNVLDNLLDNANGTDRSSERGLELIERLTSGSGGIRKSPKGASKRSAPKAKKAKKKGKR